MIARSRADGGEWGVSADGTGVLQGDEAVLKLSVVTATQNILKPMNHTLLMSELYGT